MARIDDPTQQFRLDGQVAVITGASSGLGHRFAQVLHAAGASVVIAARRVEKLQDLANELGDRVLAIRCDATDAEQREYLIDATIQKFGRIDILVNNAGIGYSVALHDETIEQFTSALDLNVTAVWHLTKLAARHMVAQNYGSIINIASMYGLVAGAPISQANYTASKGAVVNMTREIAVQLARKNVRVNALCPGFFPSEMTGDMAGDEATMKFVRATSPIPRIGEVHELDGAIMFLASRASTFMTGQTVVVDGGWTAR